MRGGSGRSGSSSNALTRADEICFSDVGPTSDGNVSARAAGSFVILSGVDLSAAFGLSAKMQMQSLSAATPSGVDAVW